MRFDQAGGISMVLTSGSWRPARTRASQTASSAALSELPGWMIGLTSSLCSPNAGATIRVSWLFIQLTLPRRVLISPLWASVRNGWASFQDGMVLVE